MQQHVGDSAPRRVVAYVRADDVDFAPSFDCAWQFVEDSASSSWSAFEVMLTGLRQGDLVTIPGLATLGIRAVAISPRIIAILETGADLHVTDAGIRSDTAEGASFLRGISYMADVEKASISAKVHKGLDAAAAEGRKGGRRPLLTEGQASECRRLAEAGEPIARIAVKFDVSERTIRRVLSADDDG
jgi:DNA invertase Pin-like site-specific DNA recombinase